MKKVEGGNKRSGGRERMPENTWTIERSIMSRRMNFEM